jgi:hypothetical protein
MLLAGNDFGRVEELGVLALHSTENTDIVPYGRTTKFI